MPPSWSLLVKEVIRSYVDLNIADLITKYNGPVKLIRRTEDEIISLRYVPKNKRVFVHMHCFLAIQLITPCWQFIA